MLIDTHNPYRPSIVDWPILDPEARDRLVSLPIWGVATQTEGNARLRVLSYADTIEDPLLREAIEIDGFEETRHKQVQSHIVQAYGIPWRRNRHTCVRDIPNGRSCSPVFASASTPSSPSACLRWPSDRDFFRLASSTPSNLWCRKRADIFSFLSIGLPRIGATCRRGDAFSSCVFTGGKAVGGVEMSAAVLIGVCLSEHERRFAGYDARLLRPNVMPYLMRFASCFLRRRSPAAAAR
jgi:hypothetical protein